MASARDRFLSLVGRALLALAAGIVCGASLVALYIYSSIGEPLVFEGLWRVSIFYGAAIAAICVPLWLALAGMGWGRAWVAAVLGFTATATFLLLTYTAGSHPRLHLMAYGFLPYALCGAIGALATWWVDRLLARGAGR